MKSFTRLGIALLIAGCTAPSVPEGSDGGPPGADMDVATEDDGGGDTGGDAAGDMVPTDALGPQIDCSTTHREPTGDLEADLVGTWFYVDIYRIDWPVTVYDLRPGGELRVVSPAGFYDEAELDDGTWRVDDQTLVFDVNDREWDIEIMALHPAAFDAAAGHPADGRPWFRVECSGFGFGDQPIAPEPTCADEPDPNASCKAEIPGSQCFEFADGPVSGAACAYGRPTWPRSGWDDNHLFDDTMPGDTDEWSFEMRNEGVGPLEVTVTVDDPAFQVSPDTFDIPAMQQADVTVTFAPTDRLYHDAELTVQTNAGSATARLRGNEPCLRVVSEPGFYDFGDVPVGEEASATLPLVNCGIPDVTVTSAELSDYSDTGGPNEDYEFTPPALPLSLVPGETGGEFTVTYRPLSERDSRAIVEFSGPDVRATKRFIGHGPF